mmetsp:Transcript_35388/g.93035  ORF Transcript_35388/g.93035 Transcript_35388/m.93035 type:complete len:174 (-) Transcript_35388:52-573(-)
MCVINSPSPSYEGISQNRNKQLDLETATHQIGALHTWTSGGGAPTPSEPRSGQLTWMAVGERRKIENKRAGIFYGSLDGHPVTWSNDWTALIKKEMNVRDKFTQSFIRGDLPKPKQAVGFGDGNASDWRSTYMDLGRWGADTFRASVRSVNVDGSWRAKEDREQASRDFLRVA